MRGFLRASVLSGFTLVCLLAFQNCSKVGFTNDPAAANAADSASVTPSGTDTPTCQVDLVNSTKSVKVLFLIDTSGSNQSNNNGAGTDMGKVWRLATINSFINVYGSKSNFDFGFATFQGTTAQSLILENGHGIFTHDMTTINKAITDFTNMADKGTTPYDAALAVVKDMISYDKTKAASKNAGYVVVMISDGSPTNTSYTDSKNGMSNLTSDVKSLLAVASGQISLNAVFLYNQTVASASEKIYLQTIASLGSGAFIEASSQQTLKISDSVQIPAQTCQ